MAIAIVATLLTPHVLTGPSTPWLIALGLVDRHRDRNPGRAEREDDGDPADGGAVQRRRRRGGGDHRVDRVPPPFRDGRSVAGWRSRDPTLFAAIVGSISFWGSNIAFGKLQEILPGRPIKLPGQSVINLVLFAICVISAIVLAAGTHSQGLFIVGILLAAAILGNMVVLPIGGADMPVVISLLNAFTGLSAAATGIALNNTAMIVAGMIVGASGTILTNLMAKAMNRSVPAIVAGGFGGAVAAPSAAEIDRGPVRSTSAQDVAIQLSYARQVVIAPGYGMAVAQAQHAVRELERALETRGVVVKYAIHPVAGPDAGPHERAARRG